MGFAHRLHAGVTTITGILVPVQVAASHRSDVVHRCDVIPARVELTTVLLDVEMVAIS